MKKLFEWIRTKYRGTSNAFKAGVNTTWQAFVGAFTFALLGFLSRVQEAVDTGSGQYPELSVLSKGVASAILGLSSGIVALIFRSVKPGPQYAGSKTDAPMLEDQPPDEPAPRPE